MSGVEVERKFLVVVEPPALGDARRSEIDQGYLVLGEEGGEARVRRRDGELTLTVKRGSGLVRAEREIGLSAEQFELLWPLTEGQRVQKTRSEVQLDGGLVAEVDVYAGALAGLTVVEVEFADAAAAEAFAALSWFGTEVTDDPAYKNRALAVDGRPE